MSEPVRSTGAAPARAFGAVLDRLREKRREVLPGSIPPRAAAGPPGAPGQPDTAPLSFAQQRLWFLARLRPDDTAYNVAAAVEVRGPVDTGALAEAFRLVAARHEALRTTFGEVDGEPVQVVHTVGAMSLPVVDLSGSGEEGDEAERLARAEAARPFDLGRGPLLRTVLVRTAPERHLLLLTLHHLVSDAWSMGVLIREVSAFYRATLEGRPALLPALPVQYADFAVWQRERWLREGEADALERALGWWRERLAGAPPELDLPADRARPATSRGGRRPFSIRRDLADHLDALARSAGTTLFVALLAGFQALLHRWSGQGEVVVGSPFANRRRAELQGLIGFFVNTLPVRSSLAGRPAFRELLGRVREEVAGVHEHQETPFERIVEELRPEREPGRNPFFQVVLAFQNVPLPALDLPGLELALRRVDAGTAMFDLTLDLEEHPDGLRGWIEHAAGRFAPAAIERLAGHLANLLAAAAAAPDVPVADLPMLAEPERHQLLVEWNDRAAAVPRLPLHRLFEEQARVRPDAVAVEDGRRGLTYGELDARADRLARRLRKLGVGPEVPVAFCLDRSIEAVETILGILKAGGAYVPLDPAYPAERLAWMIADSGARVLVTARSLPAAPASPAPPGVATLDLGSDEAGLATLPEEVDADGLACVFYTSGSTGRPKGVAATHRNVVRLVRGTDFAAFGPDETGLLLAPLSFDASTLELWGPLLNGGRLAVFSSRVPALDELARTIAERKVTTLWLTAGLFHQMVDARPDALRSLRRLVAGGDVLSPSHVRRALAEGIAVVNGYGPTEGTTFTCCHAVREAEEPVPIGRPIANARAYVVDAGLQPVPTGVAGELLAGGLGLARGYLGRPDLTAERFIPDPWGDGERLYRTGDRARLAADGRIEFLGRLDRQVKIRGFRVEPGEVEAALARHPGIAEAVVTTWGEGADRRLIAYAVGEPLPADGLRRFLEAFLPAPLIPSAFVFLPELPLTANGKVDRAALPEPPAAGTARPVRGRLPSGPVEDLLAALWEELLGVERVGAEDGFFDLGGHSLLATRLVSRIRGAFGVELPLADLFQEPTVAAVAARIEALRRGEEPAAPILPLSPEERKGPLPLSFAQERIWLFERMQPGSPVFNMPLGVRFRGPLDAAALSAALSAVVRRHEALRTIFPEVDGRPVQWIVPWDPVPVPLVDLAGLASLGAGAPAEARRLARAAAARPFDLPRDPPLRALLVRTAPDVYEMLLTLHHIAADGWSLEILARELEAFYRGVALPDPPLQYSDWAVWQRRHLEGGALDGLRTAWRRLLRGAPLTLDLPTDRPRPAVRRFRGAVVSASVDPDLTGALAALGRSEGCTLYMTLLAAFQVLIRALSRQDAFLVGSPVSGRGRGETEDLIGFFVNMLALRAYMEGGLPFRRLLCQVRESMLAAWAHQEMPFDELVRDLRPERDPGRPAIFQVVFAWQESPVREMDLTGISTAILQPPVAAARYDLHLTASRTAGGLEFHLTYDTGLFETATADALLRRWAALLRAVCARPGDRIDKLEGGDPEMQPKNPGGAGDARERLLRVQKPKSVAGRPLVRTSLPFGRSLPLMVEPEVPDVDLAAWAAAHRGQVDEWLAVHGALLFRGFPVESDVDSVDRFREVAAAVSPGLLSYDDPTTPRTEVGAKVYTSTEYPADQAIPHHNELSYNQAWPMRIFFYCVTPPGSRGETPLADSRRVYERLGLLAWAVRERFVSRGVMYVRSFGDGVGLPWQKVFQTSEREGVEAYCRERGMQVEWREGGRLRTRHVRPAVACHPRTGETVWFNQANVHHPSSLPPALRESLLAVAADRDLPMDVNVCYGDGTPIPDEDVAAVRRVYEEENVLFPWRQGDVLAADNMLVAHGRSPFSGPRKIVVLMAESQTNDSDGQERR
jgi:amino acid adenylation domain-containing protein